MILGIDPGYGKKGLLCGLALVDKGKVLRVGTLKAEAHSEDLAGRKLHDVVAQMPGVKVVACDSFYPHRPGAILANGAAQVSLRNAITLHLAMLGVPVVFMRTQTVKLSLLGVKIGADKAEWKAAEAAYIKAIWKGKTNEHNRDAILHGVWLDQRTTALRGMT